ncbi:hypothetical protein [Allofournierella sp.]|uniref:hypothetical protein n=1 Tax=Allofournierella sp. TaxID=1940256 RepID=UPI003AEF1B9C
MSINSDLRAALEPIAPAFQDVYTGPQKTYIVFNYNSIPADFGDDAPAHERFFVQAHLYAPAGVNTLRQRKKIKAALLGAGLTWPSYTNASDKDGQHHVFECETAEALGEE